MRKKQYYIIGSFLLIGLMLIIRLWLNEVGEQENTLTTWFIFVGSLLTLFLVFFLYGKQVSTFLNDAKDIRILLFGLVLMEVFFMIKNAGTLGFTYPFGVLLSFVFWMVITMILPHKLARIWGISTIIIFGAYVIGQDTYLRIFNDYFSFKEALTLREGIESGESMYRFNWLQPVILVIMIGSICHYLRIDKLTKMTYTKAKLSYLLQFFALMMILLNMNTRIVQDGQTRFTSDHYLYTTVYARKDVANRFGVFHLMGRDIVDSLTPTISTKRDTKAIDKYFEDHQKVLGTHENVGLFEGKNFIFILAESYDEVALDPNLTPHLYQLKQESINFGNHFTPVFQRTTSDTEFIFNTGLIPSIEDGPTVTVFKKNSYQESLANLFRNKGYTTNAFHGNYKEFYARQILYKNYGYDHFYGRDELGLTRENERFDTEFFFAAKDYIIPENEPFMSFVITFSGHSPYTLNHQVVQKHIETVEALYPDDDKTMNYYRATQVELDLMIGLLFDDIEQKDLLNDTVILLSGDHYPYTMPQEVYEKYTDLTEIHLKQRGNLYLWSKDQTPQTITEMTTSFDIIPTLNALFRLGGNPTYYVGRDMFDVGSSIVLFKDYSFYNGNEYVLLKDSDATTLEAQKVSEKYLIYKKILRTNYFK